MRKILLITLAGLMLSGFCPGQTNPEYDSTIQKAAPFITGKDWPKVAEIYAEAFRTVGETGFLSDRHNVAMLQQRYDLARILAMAGQPGSAFPQLFRAVENVYISDLEFLDYLLVDTCLASLHDDERWPAFTGQLMLIRGKLDEKLIAILDTIYNIDQGIRSQINDVAARQGYESDSVHALEKVMFRQDSVNLTRVKKILDEKGWLGPEIIGISGNRTLWLVIQHSEPAVQQQYLPMMREAVNNGMAFAANLALLEDRVAIGQGEKQLYGSQLGWDSLANMVYPLPLMDPDNVDKRRQEVGLDSLREYLSGYDATWDLEEYKKRLPEYEAKLKKIKHD